MGKVQPPRLQTGIDLTHTPICFKPGSSAFSHAHVTLFPVGGGVSGHFSAP